MKLQRLFMTIVCLMMNLGFVYSQEKTVNFILQPDGIMLTNEGKDFQIINYEGESQEIIYNKLLMGVSSIFNDPKTVISKVENQIISISGIQGVNWIVGGMLGTVRVDFHYVLEFHIKDNRVKVDSPYFTMLSFSSGGTQSDIGGWLVSHKIFTKDGQPNMKKENNYKFYNDVNESFSKLTSTILNYTETEEDW